MKTTDEMWVMSLVKKYYGTCLLDLPCWLDDWLAGLQADWQWEARAVTNRGSISTGNILIKRGSWKIFFFPQTCKPSIKKTLYPASLSCSRVLINMSACSEPYRVKKSSFNVSPFLFFFWERKGTMWEFWPDDHSKSLLSCSRVVNKKIIEGFWSVTFCTYHPEFLS